VSRQCEQKLTRLQAIVAERAAWTEQLTQVKRMYGWLCEVEAILAKEAARPPAEPVSNESVGRRLDTWREQMAQLLETSPLSELEQKSLRELLQVLSNLRPYLMQCYDRTDFPRTNNDMERSIRALKTQYRRVSGRKNWNTYLLRYGRCVAYAAWWEQEKLIVNRCSTTSPGWTMAAGKSCASRPPVPSRSSSRGFVSVTSVRRCWPRSKHAGRRLLRRHLCPDGFFQVFPMKTLQALAWIWLSLELLGV
jgi:Transposase IS66 family